jgi:hypothetical protein
MAVERDDRAGLAAMLLDRIGDGGGSDRAKGETQGESKPVRRDDPVLRCRACGRPVARHEDRIEVSGAHAHTFVNPAGIIFDVGCFDRAAGCVPVGAPSAFFSWFPGYAWRAAVCVGCLVHLGWSYGERPDFWGLILTKLT